MEPMSMFLMVFHCYLRRMFVMGRLIYHVIVVVFRSLTIGRFIRPT